MSGHSRWATISRSKGKVDAARGKVFTKLGREIAVAVKLGGPDPASNSRLRDIIAKAKAANMPNDNITRSIKKAAGELSAINYDGIIYEGYGIGSSAVIVETLTDNKNRTAGEVRHIFDKFGGSMGTNGCVSYMFDNKGVIIIERNKSMDDDEIMMLALDCGAEDISCEDSVYEIYTNVSELGRVKDGLEAANMKVLSFESDKIPSIRVKLDENQLNAFNKMLDAFDDNDDVQNVFHNVDLPIIEEEE